MKRPLSVPALGPDGPSSAVHQAARRDWNELHGVYHTQARTWRLIAFGSLAVSLIAVGGAAWDHQSNHAVPYVVAVNHLGDALAISRADVAAPADPRLIRAQLARWVANVRSVYIDVAAEKRVIGEAYSMVDSGAGGAQALNDWFAAHDPFARAKDELVAVAVESVLPLSGNTWRVEWREETRTRAGSPESTLAWQATVTIAINPPSDDAAILANPAGLYVESFSWAQRGEQRCDGKPCT